MVTMIDISMVEKWFYGLSLFPLLFNLMETGKWLSLLETPLSGHVPWRRYDNGDLDIAMEKKYFKHQIK